MILSRNEQVKLSWLEEAHRALASVKTQAYFVERRHGVLPYQQHCYSDICSHLYDIFGLEEKLAGIVNQKKKRKLKAALSQYTYPQLVEMRHSAVDLAINEGLVDILTTIHIGPDPDVVKNKPYFNNFYSNLKRLASYVSKEQKNNQLGELK
ncbi:hypothetical protein HN695_07570 [Candidatus Woesearchaeota archaeon]|jgi:hypothetical protein|nr:hypothetical protein [Candidatus Woesearchaeota archaeon]MBT5272643.1 hypothetical protein [Candidatus Woesearchaeota archaeon]MBT6041720.1 hypothetical protein [Candidatus Woesearchaeota archaeon]MBT6337195.1 hypothetical protein [Candidatus Woesearchaeota archaeon]MBT7928167.1 hypothetical protein [Candidatus Woesearchaeota archaeon]